MREVNESAEQSEPIKFDPIKTPQPPAFPLPFTGPLSHVMRQIWEVNESKGWNADVHERTEGDWAALEHSEISEAFESYRNGEDHVWIDEENGNKPEGDAVERIDCLYRILHWFAAKGIDPDEVFRLKMEYNKTRPYRHGGKVI